MRKNRQLSMEFYNHLLIDKKVRTGQLVVFNEYVRLDPSTKQRIYRPRYAMCVTLETYSKASYNWRCTYYSDKKKEGLCIISTSELNRAIDSFNWSVKINRPDSLWSRVKDLKSLDRAKKSNINIGDTLIKVVKVRTRYNTIEVVYDGKMSLTGFFIKNKKNH